MIGHNITMTYVHDQKADTVHDHKGDIESFHFKGLIYGIRF